MKLAVDAHRPFVEDVRSDTAKARSADVAVDGRVAVCPAPADLFVIERVGLARAGREGPEFD